VKQTEPKKASSTDDLSRLRERICLLENEKEQLARKLEKSEVRFHDLADNTKEIISIFEPGPGRQIYVSPAYELIWERSRDSLYADPKSWLEAIHPEDRPRIQKTLDSMDSSKIDSLRMEALKDEFRIIRRNGDHRWMRARYTPIRGESGEILRVISFIEDITDWKKLETQLNQSQKMDAVGRLAGGIAHDFNNLLTVINGYSALLGERLDLSEDVQEDLKSIRKAGDRAAALTSQLLAFSRKAMLQSKNIELNRAIAGVEPMLRRLIRENVELTTFLSSEPMNVRADPMQLEQVIMNLVINARDAIESTGTITIETNSVHFDAEMARLHGNSEPGEYAMMAVSDTGRGMSAETQERIFEPFFTTKELGQGTGLGLATVYGIVKQSKGTIWVYSEEGSGTTFKVYLPLTAAPPKLEAEPAKQKPSTGTGTILLVEDDEQVRNIATEVLRKRGYQVIQASNGQEATRLASSISRIDLLVTDVIMPKMGGRELAIVLAREHPRMKVLFISGYTENATIQVASLAPGIHHLAKPFSPDALAQKVSQLLVQKAMTA
jgi:two-component system, cell cycle sensor histidine kinase and response regulator CckA